MLDRGMPKYVDISHVVAQGCMCSTNLFKVFFYDLIVEVEAARQGVTVGEDTVSGLILADGFVGISETPEGLQKKIGNTLEYTSKWRVTWHVNKCAVVVCNEYMVNPVYFSWKQGEDELPIADQYTYLGVDISKDCSRDTPISNVIGKGKTHIGNMDAILTDSHIDTGIKRWIQRCMLMM